MFILYQIPHTLNILQLEAFEKDIFYVELWSLFGKHAPAKQATEFHEYTVYN